MGKLTILDENDNIIGTYKCDDVLVDLVNAHLEDRCDEDCPFCAMEEYELSMKTREDGF